MNGSMTGLPGMPGENEGGFIMNQAIADRVKEYQTSEQEVKKALPVTCNNFFLLNHRGFNYYGIDLRKVDFEIIRDIVKGCEEVEKDCWDPQENFFDYIQKSDILAYAEKDGRIVGFNLVSLLMSDGHCIYSIDEAMVLKKCQGNNIARNVVMLTIRWFFLKTDEALTVKKIYPLSISANPKVVNNYFKNKYLTSIFDNSFRPSEKLIDLHLQYVKENNLLLVDEKYPFCVKNLFPGSNRFKENDKRYQFKDGVKKNMPDDFDHIHRGDAFSFMVRIGVGPFWFVNTLLLLIILGKKMIFNKGIGFLGSGKYQSADESFQYTDEYSDRRGGDRRVMDIGAYLDDRFNRRKTGRRTVDENLNSRDGLKRKLRLTGKKESRKIASMTLLL